MERELLINIPIAFAMLLVVREFLAHMGKQRDKDRVLWENHMSKSVEGQAKITVLLETLIDEVRHFRAP